MIKYLYFTTLIIFLVLRCGGNSTNKAKIIWEKYDNENPKIVYEYLTEIGTDTSDYFYCYYYKNGNLNFNI